MDTPENPELTALKVHRESFKDSIAFLSALPDKENRKLTIAEERRRLAEVQARIDELSTPATDTQKT
jgi:hypothetical protein